MSNTDMSYTPYKNWHIYENLNQALPYSFFSNDYDGESLLDKTKQGQALTLSDAMAKIDELERSK